MPIRSFKSLLVTCTVCKRSNRCLTFSKYSPGAFESLRSLDSWCKVWPMSAFPAKVMQT